MSDVPTETRGKRASGEERGQALLTGKPARAMSIVLFLVLLVVPIAISLRVLVIASAALIWTLFEAKGLDPLGLGRRRWTQTLIWGFGLAVAVNLFGEASQPLIERLLGMRSDYSGYGALAGNAEAALRLLGFALISAAIGEEILFRGFLLHQLTGILGSGDRARWTSIVASGVIFGAAHFIQGPLGMVSTGLVGAIFAWAWFRSDRNLWAMILAHALTDTYGITMLYLGRYA